MSILQRIINRGNLHFNQYLSFLHLSKHLNALIFCLLLSVISFGQHEPQFSQYMFSPIVFNPAFSGLDEAWVSVLDARSQWVDIPGAPQSQSISSQLPLYRINSGVGLRLVNDKAGQLQTTAVSLSYAYHIKINKSTTLSIGASAGMAYQALDGSKLIAPQGSYEGIIDHNDNYLPETLVSDIIPDLNSGIVLKTKKFELGLSALHLLGQAFEYPTSAGSTTIQYSPTGFVYLSYLQKLGSNFHLRPTVLLKSDNIESMADLNLLLDYKNNLILGASFRGYLANQSDAVIIIAGWNISERLGINYSYDITLSGLNDVSQGSHELTIGYRIPVEKPRAGKEINNLRYLYY